jgi:hypothetical protein
MAFNFKGVKTWWKFIVQEDSALCKIPFEIVLYYFIKILDLLFVNIDKRLYCCIYHFGSSGIWHNLLQ